MAHDPAYTNRDYLTAIRGKQMLNYGYSIESMIVKCILMAHEQHDDRMKNALCNGFPVLYSEILHRMESKDFSLPTDTPYDINTDTSGT